MKSFEFEIYERVAYFQEHAGQMSISRKKIMHALCDAFSNRTTTSSIIIRSI